MFYNCKRSPDGLGGFCKICCPRHYSDTRKDVKCPTCGKSRTIKVCSAFYSSNCRACGGRQSAKTTYYDKRYNNDEYKENKLIGAFQRITKKNAKKRGLEFSLTKDELRILLHQDCYYCGSPPSNAFKIFRDSDRFRTELKYQGLDRIDSNKGYITGNVRPCCIVCNHLKWSHSEEEFFRSVRTIYERHIKRQEN